MNNPGDIATNYHQRTKHHFHRHARSLGYLDWATQPDPFRRFAGAPLIELPFRDAGIEPAYDDLFTAGKVRPKPFTLDSIASLFELSLGLSAWKQFQGSRWALRINPSSGNLHPTEGYLITGPISGLSDDAGVYHYAPKEHAFERRASFPPELWNKLVAPLAGEPTARFSPSPFQGEGRGEGMECLIVALTSIHWREAWKYGERAYRYCQEDEGHALAAVAFSAAVNGWRAEVMDRVSDTQISLMLGLDRSDDFKNAEPEHPGLLMAISPHSSLVESLLRTAFFIETMHSIAVSTQWSGQANRLSSENVKWDVIDEVAAAGTRSEIPPGAANNEAQVTEEEYVLEPVSGREASAVQIIRQRRSAVDFDGKTALPARQFFSMLSRAMPSRTTPLATIGPPAHIHLGLFVHRVTGLNPGLYCLPRTVNARSTLQQAMATQFTWQKPAQCPAALPLFLLQSLDVTRLAAKVSCDQAIAGDSAFSLGFIAEFAAPLQQFGDWFYRRLHWEAGAIAQVLYLEAEAAGLRATGIGCFYDDAVHDVFGLSGTAFQSLYHFTLGGPVEDSRLTTLPPYPTELISRPLNPPARH